MKIATIILAAAAVIVGSGAWAQQSFTGSVTKVDEANGKVAIQQTQAGTAASPGGPEEFKVQDGLLFNTLQPGDKVAFTTSESGGVKTITKLEKQ